MTWYYKHHANVIHYFYTSQYSPRFIPHDVWDDGVGCVLLTFFWAEEQHSLAFNTWTSEVDTVPLPGDELSFALGKDTGASLGWDGNFLGAFENVLRHSWLDHSDCGLIIWFDTYWQTFLGRFKGIDCIMQLDGFTTDAQHVLLDFCGTYHWIGHFERMVLQDESSLIRPVWVSMYSLLPWLMNRFHDFYEWRGSWYTNKHSYMFMLNAPIYPSWSKNLHVTKILSIPKLY